MISCLGDMGLMSALGSAIILRIRCNQFGRVIRNGFLGLVRYVC